MTHGFAISLCRKVKNIANKDHPTSFFEIGFKWLPTKPRNEFFCHELTDVARNVPRTRVATPQRWGSHFSKLSMNPLSTYALSLFPMFLPELPSPNSPALGKSSVRSPWSHADQPGISLLSRCISTVVFDPHLLALLNHELLHARFNSITARGLI